jgi:hypothetical protein
MVRRGIVIEDYDDVIKDDETNTSTKDTGEAVPQGNTMFQ